MPGKVSVIIVNYKSSKFLDKCLETLAKTEHEGGIEIIVVNNSPGDGTEELIQEKHPSVILVTPGTNLGFGPANNVGFDKATGDYHLILNPDAYPPPDAISQCVAYLDAHPKVGMVGPRFINDHRELQPSARMFPTVFDKIFMLTGLQYKYRNSRIFGRMDNTWWDHSHPKRVDWCVGAFLLIPADLNKRLGGFDDRFFLYFEEWDLCRRVAKAGREVHILPHVIVQHTAGGSSANADEGERVGKQLTLLRLFAECLYYYKYWGRLGPWVMLGIERLWFSLRYVKNRGDQSPEGQRKSQAMKLHLRQLKLALKVTRYGSHMPPHPWIPDMSVYE
ncbi:Glycosyltransferase family 2 protein [Sulfidibacter corallicola]|uniref:Glycosyltransferase family 2 protein n=1 Tax=Sulfidibacter corallicola TaxID=2818388 RepID=A0A8A4TQ38_SULCO|nr:glycosyltransferase family 2 protein [Sulfidibacter corallicola]QTD51031.1 glycosyltransferase family 2 protein [Sulfidibacter corallicola]